MRSLIRLPSAADTPESQTDRNILYLYLEILFAGALGIAVTFHSTFAIRLGAPKESIAILSALPFLVATIASIPASRFMKSRKRRKRWLLGVLMFYRVGHIVIALLPALLPNDPVLASQLIVWWIVLLTLPASFFDSEWRVTLGDLIPQQRRSYVFSRRSIISSIFIAIGTTLVGWLLNHSSGSFPGNYQLMYILAFIATLGSHYFLSRLVIPDRDFSPLTADAPPPVVHQPLVLNNSMKRLLINAAIYNFGIQFYVGVASVHLVNELKATDDWVGLITAAGYVGAVIGYFVWERWLRTHEIGLALRRASLLTWAYPAALALSTSLPLIVVGNFVVNLGHPGVDLATSNMLLQLPRPEDRASFTSRYIAVVSFSSFVAPLVGVWLADLLPIGIPGIIFMSAVFRLVGAGLFNVYRSE